MKIFSIIFMLILVAFGVSFAILNSEAVVLNYYFGTHQIPLSLLLVSTLAVGSLFGFILSTPSIFRLKRGNSKLKSRIKQAEQEVENLRSIPIRDTH